VSDVQHLSTAMKGDCTSLADAAAAITTYVGAGVAEGNGEDFLTPCTPDPAG
jgi:hypothetical protein